MKGFLRIILSLFSLIIMVVAAVTLLTTSAIITSSHIIRVIGWVTASSTASIAVYIVSVLLGLLSVIAIIINDSLASKLKGGIMIQSEIGAVQISNQTFENIIIGITKKYTGIKTVKVEVKIKNKGVQTDLYAYVLQDTVIADLTVAIQEDIKETILKQTTVVVENVNIKVKGTYAVNESKV